MISKSHIFKIGILLASCCAALLADDGALLNRSACVFPAYDKVSGIESYASKTEYESAIADDRFTCEKLTYSSDGLPVIAYAYHHTGGGSQATADRLQSWRLHCQQSGPASDCDDAPSRFRGFRCDCADVSRKRWRPDTMNWAGPISTT